MAINAFPINTVPPAANLITNIPSGSITATDVQAAINQLSSLIPVVGSGTDPLFLIHGLSIDAFNPTVSGDPNDRWTQRIRITTDTAENNPNFSNNEGLEISMRATNGMATQGGITSAKITFLPLNLGATYNASGQKFLTNESITSFGMSDTAIGQQFVVYAGGPISGDEGQGFRLVSSLEQQHFLVIGQITSIPTQSILSTITTQAITGSKNVQTVTVASAAAAVDGTWVVIEQQLPIGSPNLEAVQIISHSPTSITGIFRYNHNIAVTVTPALRLAVDNVGPMGQDRVLVNLSGASYSTGTVSSISGGGFVGSGTAWANNMVGGNATNIGAIALTADDDSASPFNNATPFSTQGTLKHWYQIISASATNMGIFSFTTSGDLSYHGDGPGAGGYIVRPAARVLRLVSSSGNLTGEIICETSTHTWTVGDFVEQAICPYADVTAFSYRLTHYTRGGAGVRAFMDIRNVGHRGVGTCFNVVDQVTVLPVSWDTILNCNASCNVGLNFDSGNPGATRAAIVFPNPSAGGSDTGGTLMWRSSNTSFGPQVANGGFIFKPMLGLASGPPVDCPDHCMQWIQANIGQNAGNGIAMMAWAGSFYLPATGTSGRKPFVRIDYTTDPVNYERGFVGYQPGSSDFTVGSEKGGTGGAPEITIKADGTEWMRFQTVAGSGAGARIKFSDPLNFTANGAVAKSFTAVGPPGSATTVQKWLTIRDDGNQLRYIPCF